jgi:hypothetical protein
MTEPDTEITTLRLNVLGNLEIVRGSDELLPLPTNVRACHLLALMAIRDEYDHQELVDIFWEGVTLHHPDPDEVKLLANRLHQVLKHAREALRVGAKEPLESDQRVVRWVGANYHITSDFHEFQDLAASDDPDDWRAALALVRGRIAQHLPRTRELSEAFVDARTRQQEDIRALLERLDPEATDEALDRGVEDVLEGRYRADCLRQRAIAHDGTTEPSRPEVLPAAQAEPAVPLSSSDSGEVGSSSRRGVRFLGSRLIAVVLASVLGLGVAAWALWPVQSGNATPRSTSVIDAQTGQPVHHVPTRKLSAAETLAIQEVNALFWICNVSAKESCSYPTTEHQVTGHRGDIFECWIRLFNPTPTPIPLIGVAVESAPTEEEEEEEPLQSDKRWFELSVTAFNRPKGTQIGGELGVGRFVQMLPDEIGGVFTPYEPTYLQGSTVLTSLSPGFRVPLPDGIFDHETRAMKSNLLKRIWLTNLGTPSSCSECQAKYVRFIHFRVQIL